MKKNIILIHGAGVGGWVFRDIEKILKLYGNNVYAPNLSAIGDRKQLIENKTTLTTYAKEIEALILKNNLYDVYLIGHSFGGAVVSAVVELIPERIKYQIYIDSFFLENNESILTLFGEKRENELYDICKNEGEGKYLPKRLFGKEHPLIKDMPFSPYMEKVKFKGKGKKIPGAYIDCLDSSGFEHLERPKRIMKSRVEDRKWKYVTLDSDHIPMTKSPAREKLIEVLIDLIKNS
ncbi:alpha/beta hydrolase [Cetobacterium somerae]|uniref:alpha/beta fold hydrolase n=1 Tax=Cetobacterium sp. NK01 TaxID=2993530 RepID=UPI002116CAB2|nr:alpha/beta hydrolase [Cetobacterium sp. NK01]MCQ8211791.1 alpha/beta hydrolase [Cetobacterium sp. NK01]